MGCRWSRVKTASTAHKDRSAPTLGELVRGKARKGKTSKAPAVSWACKNGKHFQCYKLSCTCTVCDHGQGSITGVVRVKQPATMLDVVGPVSGGHGKATVPTPLSTTDAIGRQL